LEPAKLSGSSGADVARDNYLGLTGSVR
jgi:hypothetical protein